MSVMTIDAKTRNAWLLVLLFFVLQFILTIKRDNPSLTIGAYGLCLAESLGYLLGGLAIPLVVSFAFKLVSGKFLKSSIIAYATLVILVLSVIGGM